MLYYFHKAKACSMIPYDGLVLPVHSRGQGESPDPQPGAGQPPGVWKDRRRGAEAFLIEYFQN